MFITVVGRARYW